MGSELIGKSNDLSLALTQDAPVNKADSQISTDIFEQARRAFFSK
jgi:hypothetical protein